MSDMTISDLIERLSEILEEHGDLPIRAALQPNYPLLAEIDAVTTIVDTVRDRAEVYLGLAEPREYGGSDLWADDVVYVEEVAS